MKKISKILATALAACVGIVPLAGCEGSGGTGGNGMSDYILDSKSSNVVEVDFGTKVGTGVQNIKKIDQFTPTWTLLAGDTANYSTINQFSSMTELQTEGHRVDMMFGQGGLGKWLGDDANDAGNIEADYGLTDAVVDGLLEADVIPYFIMLGIPVYAQQNGSARSEPVKEKYQEFIGNFVRHYKDRGSRIIYETWNEPDLNNTDYWLNGDSQTDSFIPTNNWQVDAIKAVNPDAEVAEFGLCWPYDFVNRYWSTYMDSVFGKDSTRETKSIDAFSWHYYSEFHGDFESGAPGRAGNWESWKRIIREALNTSQKEYPVLATTQQHLTEFAPADAADSWVDQVGIIGSFYDTISLVMEATDISRVSWCSYFTEDWGLVDPYTYQRRPIYYVLWSYAQLPMDKAAYTASGDQAGDIGVMTGVDSQRAGVILWNRLMNEGGYGDTYDAQDEVYDNQNARAVTLRLKNIPFDATNCKIYLIDNTHVSYSGTQNTPYIIYDRAALANALTEDGTAEITLNLPGNTSMYVEIGTEEDTYELDVDNPIADNIVRKDYYYEDRGDNYAYGFMHEDSLTTLVSMADQDQGSGTICVTFDNMQDVESFKMRYETWGGEIAAGAGLGFRIDYHTADGYVKSHYYAVDGKQGELVTSLGTGRAADMVTSLGGTKGEYTVNLAEDAPAGWDGRIQIIYQVNDAGKGVTGKFIIC